MTENISKLRIEGGTPLVGEVHVRGAKNLVPKAMVAALHGSTPSTLRNVPDLSDVEIVTTLVELHGAKVDYDREAGVLTLNPAQDATTAAKNAEEIQLFGGNSRIPILMVGPLLHTLGTARIPNLGGCKIGDRPIDYHMSALRKFGAVVEKDDETGTTLIVPEEGLKGAEIVLNYPSVGATEQVLLTGVRAKGKTILRNAAIEPEIIDLIAVLQKMGAIIFINEDRTIVIEGVDELTGYDHASLPDRNESASWASAALATGGDIFVRGAAQKDMTAFLNQFRKMGGMSSLLAVLSRPEAFGGAIAQSSSLWQPQVMDRLDELEAAGEIDRLRHLYLEIEVGEQEWVLVPPHRELKERLEKLGLKNARCTAFNGGHDYACWRGAIVPALERIIAACREAERAERSLAEE